MSLAEGRRERIGSVGGYAPDLLPDIPGLVHGIVAIDPVVIVQCDGCGRVAIGEPRRVNGRPNLLVIQFCGIVFGHGTRDQRRLCARCRVESDRGDYDTRRLRESPSDLAFYEEQMHSRAQALFALMRDGDSPT